VVTNSCLEKDDSMKKMNVILGLVLAVFLFSTVSASAATWYSVYITKPTPKTNGDVILELYSTDEALADEDQMSFDGLARAMIDVDDEGANGMYAAVLTAMSMGQAAVVGLDEEPSSSNRQPLAGLSVTAEY
jgi:hypothetical protein